MFTEIKTANEHYFKDESGRKQGRYQASLSAGDGGFIGNYLNDKWHGECKGYYTDGTVWKHSYCVFGKEVHDFLSKPMSDLERAMLHLKYGAPLLPKED